MNVLDRVKAVQGLSHHARRKGREHVDEALSVAVQGRGVHLDGQLARLLALRLLRLNLLRRGRRVRGKDEGRRKVRRLHVLLLGLA